MEFFFFWLLFAAIVGVAASSRGRSGFGWFLLSILISPLLGLILVLVIPNKAARAVARLASDAQAAVQAAQAGVEPITDATHTRCPDCREWVRRDALVCKHCHRKLEPTPIPDFATPAGQLRQRQADAVKHAQADDNAKLITAGIVVAVIVIVGTFKYFSR
jgi:uncharacterized protein (DUF983 family)